MVGSNVLSASRRQILKYLLGSLAGSVFVGSSAGQSNELHIEESESEISLENDRIRLKLSKNTGGVKQIENLEDGVSLRNPSGPNSPKIWDIRFYTDEFSWLSTAASQQPTIQTTQTGEAGEITLEWENPKVSTPDDPKYNREFDATITVSVRLKPNDKNLTWDFDIENRDSLAIRRIQFPLITDISSLETNSQDKLVLPIRLGREITNPTQTDNWYSVRYPSGLGTMQFSALTSTGGGFFIQSNDDSGHIKQFAWGPQGNNIDQLKFYHQFEIPRNPGADGNIPYELTIGTLRGDWHDAADRYESWLNDSGLLPSEPKPIPEWYYDIGATVRADSYSRYGPADVPFDQTIERVIQAREALGTPIQFIWWGYQTHGTFGFGDWFPPKEGWESFRDSIDKITENQIAPVGFVNAVKLYEKSELFQNRPQVAKRWLKRGKDQSIKSTKSGELTTFWPHFTNDEWNDIALEAYRTWVKEGSKQIQIDGMPWGSLPDFGDHVCYDSSHDHPVGPGGKWWPNESKSKLRRIRQEVHQLDETVLLSGEGISEYHIPELDIQHTRDVFEEQKGDYREESNVIPLTQFVLGDHLLIRGVLHKWLLDYDHSQPPRYLRLALARSLTWGALPNIRIQTHQNLPPFGDQLVTFASRIAKVFKVHGQRFVTDGKLLRDPAIPAPKIPVTAITGHLADGEHRQFETDAIHTSAWRSGNERETAVILTNIDGEKHNTAVNLDAAPFHSDTSRIYYTVINGQYEKREFGDESSVLELSLSQDDVVLVVSAPATNARESALEQLIAAQKAATADQEEILLSAKRAFVNDEFTRMKELATEITENARTDKAGKTTIGENQTGTTSPGFGISAAMSAIAGVGYLFKKRMSPNDER